MSGTFINYRTKSVAMDYAEFAPRLYHLCKHFGFRRGHMQLASAFCADEDQGYPLLILTKHFGAFPVDVGTKNGGINYQEIPQQPDTDLVIVQASMQIEFEHSFKTIVREKKYQGRNLVYIAGAHQSAVEKGAQAFVPTLFVPWAAYIQPRNGKDVILKQLDLVRHLNRYSVANSDEIDLEVTLREMERHSHLRVIDSDTHDH